MSSRSQQQGFAIALLLWMIAGMSLMVAAVIHFARADVGMAELRHSEAKVVAAARGVAMLSIREAKMMLFSKDGESQTADDNGGAGLEEVSSLKFNYQLPRF